MKNKSCKVNIVTLFIMAVVCFLVGISSFFFKSIESSIADSQIKNYYAVTGKGSGDKRGFMTVNAPAADATKVTIEIVTADSGGMGRTVGGIVSDGTNTFDKFAGVVADQFNAGRKFTFDLEETTCSIGASWFNWTNNEGSVVNNPTTFGIYSHINTSNPYYGTYQIKAYDDKGTDLGVKPYESSFTVGENLVTFDSNGGDAVDPIAVNDGEIFNMPLSPAKENCVFSAWYSDEALTQRFTNGTTISENTTLYAKWISVQAMPTYTVKKYAMVDTYAYPQSLLSRFAPDAEAEYVTMEFTISERNTETSIKQLGVSVANANNVKLVKYQNISSEWLTVNSQTESYKHTLVFDVKNGSVVYKIVKNGTETVMYLNETFDASEYSHYGFAVQNSGLEATFSIKCYDNTGKDLQVTAANGGWYIGGLIEGDGKRLTDFSDDNFLVTGGICQWYDYSYQEMAFDTERIYATSNDKLTEKGANGNVLVIKSPDRMAKIGTASAIAGTFGIQFGTGLKKSDIDKGGSLVIRTWSENANYFQYGGIYPIDNGKEKADLSLIKNIAINNGNEFKSWELSNEQLKKLCDSNGDFNGFNLVLSASGPNDYTIYIDEIYYKLPVSVEFKDKDGVSLGSQNAFSGEKLDVSISAPKIDGYIIIGWTEANGSFNVYDTQALGFDKQQLTFYPCYAKELTDPTVAVGVYASQVNGKYFELTRDGKVKCQTGALDYSKYFAAEGVTVFDGVNVCQTADGKITVGGVEYEKQSTAYKVTYKLFDDEYASVNVPSGYKAVNLEYETQDYIFGGWQKNGEIYDFSQVTEDLVLTAAMTINEKQANEYDSFENAYYNPDNGIIYILKRDESGERKIVKVENGIVNNIGEYKITVTDKLFLNQKLYKFGTNEKDGYVSLLTIDGVNYWRFDRKINFVIHYKDAEDGNEKVETIVLTKDHNYVFNKPEDPDREGYIFKGWVTGNGEEYTFDKTITQTTEIYAVWEKNNITEPIKEKIPVGAIILTIASVAVIVASVITIVCASKKKRS